MIIKDRGAVINTRDSKFVVHTDGRINGEKTNTSLSIEIIDGNFQEEYGLECFPESIKESLEKDDFNIDHHAKEINDALNDVITLIAQNAASEYQISRLIDVEVEFHNALSKRIGMCRDYVTMRYNNTNVYLDNATFVYPDIDIDQDIYRVWVEKTKCNNDEYDDWTSPDLKFLFDVTPMQKYDIMNALCDHIIHLIPIYTGQALSFDEIIKTSRLPIEIDEPKKA